MKQTLLTICLIVFALPSWGGTNIINGKISTSSRYSGTIFEFKDVINSNDPSTFQQINYIGRVSRIMFDRRKDDWIKNNAYSFYAKFDNVSIIEILVNSEFKNSDYAMKYALQYSKAIGQLPNVLRKDVKTVWIHKGKKAFGGGNNNILIHIGQGEDYISKGILEETLIHEASHTSLNWDNPSDIINHGKSKGWLSAQIKDNEFISNYAKKHPTSEDIAESFLTWIVVRHRQDRVDKHHIKNILKLIPNRIKYFDMQNFNMYPLVSR